MAQVIRGKYKCFDIRTMTHTKANGEVVCHTKVLQDEQEWSINRLKFLNHSKYAQERGREK